MSKNAIIMRKCPHSRKHTSLEWNVLFFQEMQAKQLKFNNARKSWNTYPAI